MEQGADPHFLVGKARGNARWAKEHVEGLCATFALVAFEGIAVVL
jgi:hypothetical protein